jgi:hypothetical protein
MSGDIRRRADADAYERLLLRPAFSSAPASLLFAAEKMPSTLSFDSAQSCPTSSREYPAINNIQIKRSSADSDWAI